MRANRCRALIVEDDADASAAFANMLALLGHQVTVVSTAGEAIALLRANPYDALILDLVLPDENGMVVLREVRERELPVKVAVVTALFDDDQSPRFGGIQPDMLFKKPVDAPALAGWIAESGKCGQAGNRPS